MTTSNPAPRPAPRPASPPPRTPELERGRLLHYAIPALLVVGFTGYVLHQHPALRETAAAVGGFGGLVLPLLLSAARTR
ncbi:hypothetical protein ACF1G0_33880 [Streptomyces sp. NPDC013953]|uniref:hypothetical protein n=1 Tax=Streptomyces sp. NPDC013953 TaxID=3364868 RepID=UPI0036FDFAA8